MGAFVSTTFLPNGSSVFEAIELLVQSNIKTIELGSNHRCELNMRQKLANYKDCKFLTDNFFPPEGRDLVINLGSRNPEILEKSLNFVKTAIDFSEEVGAEIYTVHPGFIFILFLKVNQFLITTFNLLRKRKRILKSPVNNAGKFS